MEHKEILENIRTSILNNPTSFELYDDFFNYNKLIADEDYKGCRKQTYADNTWLRNQLNKQVRATNSIDMYKLLRSTYLYSAKDIFEDYMIFLEWDREPSERFYLPRAKVLKPLIDGIQELVDGDLDELFLSMPPRVGKTTMLMFLVTWLIGRDSEKSNLYSAFSDTITSAFYNGVVEVINDPTTYNWAEVFPTAQIVGTNSKEETLNIDRKKRYPSLTCRSLYGTLNGACDCAGFLISDDLIGGIEEALNKDRLISAWSKVDNNLIPRAKESARLLWCGTRWSIADPAGNRMSALVNDRRFKNRRYKIINLPALNEKGESNFQYDFGVGFSTEFYQMRKASFEHMGDLASWDAQYMGQPVERSGRLFEPTDMKYFNGDLPDEEHLVRKFMAVDPAFGGGDYTAAPIAYEYDDGSTFIVDVVYSNADKRFTQPLLANKIIEHELKAVQFEANKMTASFKEKVEELIHEQGYKCNITYRPAPTHVAKEVRIFDKAPEIKDYYFLEGDKRSGEYEQFMQNVFSFTLNGKNTHDDAPDSLSMLVEMQASAGTNMRLRKRTF